MWRPEGWENPYISNWKDIPIVDEETTRTDRDLYFEAGADAMLEALKKEATALIVPGDRKVHLKEEDGCSFAVIIKRKGTLVFIPDDK